MYAAAPQARVAFSPKRIAITIASTDPSTLEAAFMAHAHSMAFESCKDALSLARERNPVGKGIPMTKPNGTSMAAQINSFMMKGCPISKLSI